MSNQCLNILRFSGEKEDISEFLGWLESNSNFGGYLLNLEKEGEDEELEDNLPVESAYPWVDTFFISKEEVTWDSRNYPSLISVIKLSKQFPNLTFVLDYEQTGGDCKGNLEIIDGVIDQEDIVDYSREVLDILVDDFYILSLNKGEKIGPIGKGMVYVICTEVNQESDGVTKTFNIQFQCDDSPTFVIELDNDGALWNYEYSDNDGNDSIEDSGYYYEMVADLQ